MPLRHRTAVPLAMIAVTFLGGCARHDYRARADRDVRYILGEKTVRTPWQLPPMFDVYPNARSRFFDPTSPDAPILPGAAPALDAYPLPPLATGDPRTPTQAAAQAAEGDDQGAPLRPAGEGAPETLPTPPPQPDADDSQGELVYGEYEPPRPVRLPMAPTLEPVAVLRLSSFQEVADEAPDDEGEEFDVAAAEAAEAVVPIPPAAWEGIPPSALQRMLEFESVRAEYHRTYRRSVPDELVGEGPRLTLPNIMELALLNSREYQTRKEVLYRVALRLTRERFEFQLRPTPSGNGTAVDYRHRRIAGETINTLSIPSGVGVQQTLATGGDFLARFANSVVLTFNGPQGFAADVGSEMLFDFQQSIFQRDIRFESLTQAERDVVYAARDFVRFRKQFFRDISGQYYSLLLAYRAIEIDSQDYFSNQRAFLQGDFEYRETGRVPRVQVDQFEQNALSSRSRLVGSSNSLESGLDRLKLAIGLPPEMAINLDLSEFELLTLSDELTVARELVVRTLREVHAVSGGARPDLTAMVNASSVLADRIADIRRMGQRLADREDEVRRQENGQLDRRLQRLTAQLALLEERLRVERLRADLAGDEQAVAPATPLQIYYRIAELIESLLLLVERAEVINQLDRGEDISPTLGSGGAQRLRDELRRLVDLPRLRELRRELRQLDERLSGLIETRQLQQIPVIVQQAQQLRGEVESLAQQIAGEEIVPMVDPDAFAEQVQQTVAAIVVLGDAVIEQAEAGLPEIEVDPAEAMLTALVQRLDLMNVRGDLADTRRQIKIAADELRSVLNVGATQLIRTRSGVNRPFDFTFQDSETRLNVALDTPLNRRIQRNNFRLAQLNYNAALRALIGAEDAIKFDIREDLRQIQLRRNQYQIAISSAALAYERVVSTRVQLQTPGQDVVARDFLEAQQAYTASLSTVARQHIEYIRDRIELFFNLEAIDLDPLGYWEGLQDEQLQPPVNLNFPAMNPWPYGVLPPRLHFSEEIRSTQ